MNDAILFGLCFLFYRVCGTRRRIKACQRLRVDPLNLEMPAILAQMVIWLIFLVLFLSKGVLPQ